MVLQEYAGLHRRYGTIHQLRQALSANASLASNHSVLAALLRALPTASSSLSAPPSFARNWPGDSSGGDAHGAFAGFDQGFGPGPQRISDDHVQQALKMAMSNMGADSEARGSQTMLQSDADMQDLTQDLVSSPASHLAGASTRKDGDDLADIEQMLADQRSAAESMETSMEVHKQALLDLCCRDPLALASLLSCKASWWWGGSSLGPISSPPFPPHPSSTTHPLHPLEYEKGRPTQSNVRRDR